jgi:hypothetical protein
MYAHEVVVHVKQSDHSDMVFQLLAEGICQPSEPPHIHSHIEILSLDVAGDVSFACSRQRTRFRQAEPAWRKCCGSRGLGLRVQAAPTLTSSRRIAPFDTPVMRDVERMEAPSTNAEMTATFFAVLITFATVRVYDSAFA